MHLPWSCRHTLLVVSFGRLGRNEIEALLEMGETAATRVIANAGGDGGCVRCGLSVAELSALSALVLPCGVMCVPVNFGPSRRIHVRDGGEVLFCNGM